MCKKIRDIRAQKSHNSKSGKSGFTLVELSVVLALLAILTTMIVSFSVLMHGFAAENSAEYQFLEDHAMLKEKLCTWAAENDVQGNVFTVTDGALTVTQNGTPKYVSFKDGVLTLGGEKREGLDAIDGMTFTTDTGTDESNAEPKLIKCVTYRIGKNGQRVESSFVFSLRCGTIEEVATRE
jgi:prepilin-type N-terminal cleavage/methylation domain-containing protein